MKNVILFLFTLWFFVIGAVSHASVKVEGELVATKACEAFVSFRKQTNPGGMSLTPGISYPVFEANKAEATRYRIRIEDAKPKERWVSADCGDASVQMALKATSSKVSSCNTPGLADSFKLALSWHPAFCETKPDKPECKLSDPGVYRAQNFTLHGLWPNKKSCGISYGFCGEVKQVVRPFCNYPALKLSEQTRSRLNAVMPSAEEGSCLQRHEWFKHGVCKTDWDVNQYYEVSVRLTREFNESGIAKWMHTNLGKTVATRDFQARVDMALGPDSHKRLALKCKKGNLVDVYINLPLALETDQPLSTFIAKASEDYSNSCGSRFRIDPIGVGR